MPRGGFRPGAGRKRNAGPATVEVLPPVAKVDIPGGADAYDYFNQLMHCPTAPLAMRNYAAAQLLPYQRAKVTAMGVKERRDRDAWMDEAEDNPIALALRN